MNSAEIATQQYNSFKSLLDTIIPDNKFYAERLGNLKIPDDPKRFAKWFTTLPFTRKAELSEDQRLHPPYGSNISFEADQYSRFCQTSGTSGAPLRWLDNAESWQWMLNNWKKILTKCNISDKDRFFFAFSFGPFLGFWTAFEAACQIGALAIPGGSMNSKARLQCIVDNQVSVLCCTPTYAVRLGELAHQWTRSGQKLPVKAIVVAGEPGGSVPTIVARIEALWQGARVYDHHGMTEVGPVSYECPARRGVLHILEPEYIPEILEPGGDQPVQPGSAGELILTNPGRAASPLIRYRTGDLVKAAGKPGSQCRCGSYELALEGGIIGRADDMLIVRGVNIHPSSVDALLRSFEAVVEYRATVSKVRNMHELRLEIELSPGETPEIAGEVEQALNAALSLRIPVSVVSENSLPRFEMKARRWIRED